MNFPSILIPMLAGFALPPPAAGGGGAQPPAWLTFLPFIVVIGLFYMLLIAPARKKQSRTQEMLSRLKSGDKVIMTSGILGTIVAINHDIVTMKIADKVKIDVTLSSIAGHQKSEREARS